MYFYKNINIIEINQPHIIIRPHPSEKSKYDWFINKNPKTISLSENDDLLTDIMKSSIVVGCNTMAMVVGLLAGKKELFVQFQEVERSVFYLTKILSIFPD